MVGLLAGKRRPPYCQTILKLTRRVGTPQQCATPPRPPKPCNWPAKRFRNRTILPLESRTNKGMPSMSHTDRIVKEGKRRSDRGIHELRREGWPRGRKLNP